VPIKSSERLYVSMFKQLPKKPKSRPFSRLPPVPTDKCRPTLLLSLPAWVPPLLQDVLRNDLMYSSSSTWNWNRLGDGLKLHILQMCDGDALLLMTKAFGGTSIVPESDMFDSEGEVIESALAPHQSVKYQAIVVDDTSMVHVPAVARFVANKFQTDDCSVVIMAIEGIFNLRPYAEHFGVNWHFAAYTKRYIRLTERGHQILSTDAFLPTHEYTKAAFVESQGEGGENDALFVEYHDPRDYEDESSDEEGNRVPPPGPGSPVVCSVMGNKSVSYFGFVNSGDVSYGAIVLRLCYAAQHAASHQE
jgi:hypothetical protein